VAWFRRRGVMCTLAIHIEDRKKKTEERTDKIEAKG